ncbi:hypothetical protein VD0002_g3074 [Verticillium dahliae]|uniref:Uncharacterized protein n=1 Tax=Verticillium dahliae TaxID=27337 RepID=A0AA45AQH3_VERDA|nr:hypothetical protein BJF96_g1787 [Verticillium dahliae]PNH53678.1 hypothetical protein VD0003_g3758 [Verticillium dahliae]PNH66203.1 hypothetical protein VD0002_g3074 [Verticillium dahliae]
MFHASVAARVIVAHHLTCQQVPSRARAGRRIVDGTCHSVWTFYDCAAAATQHDFRDGYIVEKGWETTGPCALCGWY